MPSPHGRASRISSSDCAVRVIKTFSHRAVDDCLRVVLRPEYSACSVRVAAALNRRRVDGRRAPRSDAVSLTVALGWMPTPSADAANRAVTQYNRTTL